MTTENELDLALADSSVVSSVEVVRVDIELVAKRLVVV